MKYSPCPECNRKGVYEKGLFLICRYADCSYRERKEMSLEWRRQPDGSYKAQLGRVQFQVTPECVLMTSTGHQEQFTEVEMAMAAAERMLYEDEEE